MDHNLFRTFVLTFITEAYKLYIPVNKKEIDNALVTIEYE